LCETEELDLQDGNAIIGKLLYLLVPTGDLEGRRVAPRVVVESKEVGANGVVSAVHVRGHFVAVRLDISSGVSDGNLSEAACVHVRLHVAGDSLDKGCAVRRSIVVDDLICAVEQQCVVVLRELLHGGEDALQVILVVRWGGLVAADGVLGRVHVESEVDASISLGKSASIAMPERNHHTRALMHSL
jgi:hypothetical protein